MQSLLATIQQWHIHPVIDHFTVAIFVLAVVADLVASLFSNRLWLRYAALALMIVAAGAAWGSSVTGGWEADKVWKAVKAADGPAFDVLKRHAWLGDDIIPWVITALAVWRIGVQVLGFIASSRPLYLIVSVAALILVSYQGYLGGALVYDYGVGTATFAGASQPTPAASETPSGPATPIPTVYVPAAGATPAAGASATAPAATPAESGSAGAATPSASPSTPAAALPSAAPSPAAAPSASATAGGSTSKADDLKASSTAPGAAPGTTIRPPDPHPGATSL
ncbi:MAG TPA: DUF2231 domain-containing protein [Candidatus Binataceae bacterium]|jgi:uncharacterized membrane protein|nr:DUF2231 domain-containing protein [Candidatus Binataceae bacterium]